MMRTRRRSHRVRIVPVILATVMLVAVPAYAASGSDSSGLPGVGTTARYGDHLIDLTHSWSGAGACVVWPDKLDMPECFDTEAEMNRRIAQLEAEVAPASVVGTGRTTATSGSSCASYLRMYDGTWYTGAVLYLRGRWQWFNLADYGFDQRTSSYRIGACAARFADWENGGGSRYPTSEAYDVAPTMLSGWNNDVSSVYIT
ncbi:MAG: hypothetical protein GWP04_12295 [Gammaproteobacteria bacterium]|nr:hypothetical protein [Gammaproteobacteria bacterium]